MKSIKTSISIPALLAALIAGGGVLALSAHAMPGAGPLAKPRCEARQGQNPQAWMAQRHAQHMAALKEKLQLVPEQEAAWNSFAAAVQPGLTQAGTGPQGLREDFQKLGTVERLDKLQAIAEARHARMRERTEAIKAFYARLTPQQQKVFDAEAMPMSQHHMHSRRVQS